MGDKIKIDKGGALITSSKTALTFPARAPVPAQMPGAISNLQIAQRRRLEREQLSSELEQKQREDELTSRAKTAAQELTGQLMERHRRLRPASPPSHLGEEFTSYGAHPIHVASPPPRVTPPRTRTAWSGETAVEFSVSPGVTEAQTLALARVEADLLHVRAEAQTQAAALEATRQRGVEDGRSHARAAALFGQRMEKAEARVEEHARACAEAEAHAEEHARARSAAEARAEAAERRAHAAAAQAAQVHEAAAAKVAAAAAARTRAESEAAVAIGARTHAEADAGAAAARAAALATAAATAGAAELRRVTAEAEEEAEELRGRLSTQAQVTLRLKAHLVAESAARASAEAEGRSAKARGEEARERTAQAAAAVASAEAERARAEAERARSAEEQQRESAQLQSGNEALRTALGHALEQRTEANTALDAAQRQAAASEARAIEVEADAAQARAAAQEAQEAGAALRPQLLRLQQRCDEMQEQVSRREAEAAAAAVAATAAAAEAESTRRAAMRDAATDPAEECLLLEQASAAKISALLHELRASQQQASHLEAMQLELMQWQEAGRPSSACSEDAQSGADAEEVQGGSSDDEDGADARAAAAATDAARRSNLARGLLAWYCFTRACERRASARSQGHSLQP